MNLERELLTILMDVNPIEWRSMQTLNFNAFLNQLFLYLKQLILADTILPPAIIAFNQGGARLLYPTEQYADKVHQDLIQATNENEINQYFYGIATSLKEFTSEELDRYSDESSPNPSFSSRLDEALSIALCHINAHHNQNIKKRILVLSVSQDGPTQFEAAMNCLFAANRLHAVIDTIVLKKHYKKQDGHNVILPKSRYLSQAASLTGGFIKIVQRPELLVQYLLSLPDLTIRDYIQLPAMDPVDFIAPEVRNGNLISKGFICPTCLSIVETWDRGACPACQTRQKTKTLSIDGSKFDPDKFDEM